MPVAQKNLVNTALANFIFDFTLLWVVRRTKKYDMISNVTMVIGLSHRRTNAFESGCFQATSSASAPIPGGGGQPNCQVRFQRIHRHISRSLGSRLRSAWFARIANHRQAAATLPVSRYPTYRDTRQFRFIHTSTARRISPRGMIFHTSTTQMK